MKWTDEITIFNQFLWVDLRKAPDWTQVKNSFKVLVDKFGFDFNSKSAEIFKQFGSVKMYCTAEKIAYWNENKVPGQDKWVEIFKHFEKEKIALKTFSIIVEYALCFPGTSTPAERLFSDANHAWRKEKSALKVTTLKSILNIRYNMEFKCAEFYQFLNSHQDILKKISTQDKYDFKKPKPKPMSSPGAMSIDSEQSF